MAGKAAVVTVATPGSSQLLPCLLFHSWVLACLQAQQMSKCSYPFALDSSQGKWLR